MSGPTREDRRDPRRRVQWQGEWQAIGFCGEAEILDVSACGVFLRILPLDAKAVPVGLRVRVLFGIPGRAETIDAWTTVRWSGRSRSCESEGFGLVFDAPSPILDEFAQHTT